MTDIPRCLWPLHAELGEGPVWLQQQQALYFVDVKGQQIHRCCADGQQRSSWAVPQQLGFIVPTHNDDFICGLQGGLHYFNTATGLFSIMLAIEPELPGNRLNDGHVDALGRLWFGSMDNAETVPTGSLYCVDNAEKLLLQDSDYVITNGPVLSPDGRTLYHNDTVKKIIYAFDVAANSSLNNKRIFMQITATGHPDGMAVDTDGYLWVAMFGGWRIDRYSPSGELVATIPFPCANITKLSFGGDDMHTVFVTTAWKGLTPQERVQQPQAGSLFSFRSDSTGLPQHRFGQVHA